MKRNDEGEFRLRPRKPPASAGRREGAAWSKAFKLVIHQARNSRNRKRTSTTGISGRSFHQRCAVRVTYSRNVVKGQWRAHGRYLGRDSATGRDEPESAGFDADRDEVDASAALDQWQRTGDERLWKLIVSPEFGERIDLPKLTRGLMQEMAAQLKTDLEWAAVAHYNTGHPHVHVALRGVDSSGNTLRLERDFIKNGIRAVAEDLCTRQIGHRTERDAAEAAAREVREQRYTSLDREIRRAGDPAGNATAHFTVVVPSDARVGRKQFVAERLVFLERAGLAINRGANTWDVLKNFETVLRAMQRATDRQRTIAAHGALVSDERLPFATLDLKNMTSVEGRVLVHGEEENGRDAGRCYFLLEGTDAHVYYVPYVPDIERARHEGKLRTNSLVRLRNLVAAGTVHLAVDDFGSAETILTDKRHLEQAGAGSFARGIIPAEDGWGGWLGRYQRALKQTVDAMLRAERTRRESERGGR